MRGLALTLAAVVSGLAAGGCVATAADLRQRPVDESFVVPADVDVLADRIARTERFGSWAQCLYRTGVFMPGSHSEFEIAGPDPVWGTRFPPTGTVELHAAGRDQTRVEFRLKRTVWGGFQADVEPIRDGIRALAGEAKE